VKIYRIADGKKWQPLEGMCDTAVGIVDYISKHEEPSDEQIHKWAEENNVEHEKVEEIIYYLFGKLAKFLVGGRANEKGVTAEDVDPEELRMGTDIETEHIDDKDIAKRIALDHLAEIPNYYTLLKKMEEDAGVED